MTKRQFIDRLLEAGARAREFALSLGVVSLPSTFVFSLQHDGSAFLGGRLVAPDALVRVDAVEAGSLVWVDGRVPAWVNIAVCARDGSNTELEVRFSTVLVDSMRFDSTSAEPFRVRGPTEACVAAINSMPVAP